MFGIGSKNMSSSMIPMYLFLCILIANQFVFIHSLVFIHHDQDQVEKRKLCFSCSILTTNNR
jgi:hypothetical protein